MKVFLIIYLFYLGNGGVTNVGPFTSMESCLEAAKPLSKQESGSVVYRCVEVK